jgi:hypothetical protein
MLEQGMATFIWLGLIVAYGYTVWLLAKPNRGRPTSEDITPPRGTEIQLRTRARVVRPPAEGRSGERKAIGA